MILTVEQILSAMNQAYRYGETIRSLRGRHNTVYRKPVAEAWKAFYTQFEDNLYLYDRIWASYCFAVDQD